MFFRRSQAALFERLLKEKDREITILVEQIEYLRMLLAERGAAPLRSAIAPVNPSEQPVAVRGTVPFLSEEEEDVLALHESGIINDVELAQLRESLGLPDLQRA